MKLAFSWCGDVTKCKLKLESTNSKAKKKKFGTFYELISDTSVYRNKLK